MTTAGVPEFPRKGWKKHVTKAALRLVHLYYRWSRGMTLGVRAACFDGEGRVFLVRHTYLPGWYMPGGGVERDETVEQALVKELREEGNLELLEPPELLHVYLNTRVSRRDHVLFYRVRVRQTSPRLPDREIAESGFFPLEALPADTTDATLARLAELAGARPRPAEW
nr:NUDIX domain-containing protein [uncultured Gellertiella sp.]